MKEERGERRGERGGIRVTVRNVKEDGSRREEGGRPKERCHLFE